MDYFARPFTPNGSLLLPPSKSYSHRYLIGAFILNKPITIKNINWESEDVLFTYEALVKMGAVFQKDCNNNLNFIKRNDNYSNKIEINVGASASTLRMLLPLCAYLFNETLIKGDVSLFKRPLAIYEEILAKQHITYIKTKDAINIKGKIKIEDFAFNGNISSQFVTGILFLYAYAKSQNIITLLGDIESLPYIDMTINVLQKIGYYFSFKDNKISLEKIESCRLLYLGNEIDYSLLANFAILASIKGSVKFKNYNKLSLQPEVVLIDLLKQIGAQVENENDILIIKSNKLNPFNIDISNAIDLGPILMALASFIKGESIITGYNRLKIKESNRLEAMINELKKADVNIKISENKLIIKGKYNYKGNYTFDTYNDHRIAMALTIFATLCKDPSTIIKAEVINKSCKNFIKILESLNNENSSRYL